MSATFSGATPERDLQALPTYIGTTIAQGDTVNQLHSAIVSKQRLFSFSLQNRNETPLREPIEYRVLLKSLVAVHTGAGSAWRGPANREPDQADPDFALLFV